MLVNYTKFRLKPGEEIQEVFDIVGHIIILSCAKCYLGFEQETGKNMLDCESTGIEGRKNLCQGVHIMALW